MTASNQTINREDKPLDIAEDSPVYICFKFGHITVDFRTGEYCARCRTFLTATEDTNH